MNIEELNKLDAESDYMTQLRIRQIKMFEENGFSREEAIMLTIDSAVALQRLSQQYKKH